MHDAYSDIRSRISEEPVWYDIHGVPRYDQPHVPRHLMGRIRCQACAREFWVSLVDNIYRIPGFCDDDGRLLVGSPCIEQSADLLELFVGDRGIIRNEFQERYFASEHLHLRAGWHYGDPPQHDGCPGSTMNSVPEYEWPNFWPEE